MNIYNEKLKSMIQSRGLKNSWIAGKMNIDATLLTYWITGKKQPSPVQEQQLASILGCHISQITKEK